MATEKTLTLSTGASAVVRKGKGRVAIEAQKQAGANSAKLIAIMTALVTTIDGHIPTIEDLEDLPLEDYLAIQAAFGELNFTQVALA